MPSPGANPLRLRLEHAEVLLGGWCTLPSSFAAELVGSSGVDYAVVDMQHGLASYSDLISMLQAIRLTGAVPLVRIPFEDYGLAQRALDAAGLSACDLDAFIPHQANMRITDAMVRAMKLPEHLPVARDIATTGNTSAASIPLAIDRMLTEGEVASGDIALLIGFGAGLAYASQIVRIP